MMGLEGDFPAILEERLGKRVSGMRCQENWLILETSPEDLKDLLSLLKGDPFLFTFLTDITAVDRLGKGEEKRFQMVYHLYSPENRKRARVKIGLEEGGEVPTTSGIWKGAGWLEREVFDMFGVRFSGHRDLRRILCHDEFAGHPLLKDYPLRRRQKLSAPSDLLESIGGMEKEGDSQVKKGDRMLLNWGPAHPVTHGIIRVLMSMEGETITDSHCEIGYLHRGFEKMCEKLTYTQIIPLTDRLNYVSPFMNSVAFCLAVERLLDVEVPEKARAIRVIGCEINRIMDHLVQLAANILDLAALTPYWYLFNFREKLYDIFEEMAGVRMTVNYARVGGVSADFPAGMEKKIKDTLKELEPVLKDVMGLISRNRIFIERTKDIGVMPPGDAVSYGWTGPCLRASGVHYDVRKAEPYTGYEIYDFDIPLGERGDTLDRIMVRFEEMRQSTRIILQALDGLPEGPHISTDPIVALPPKGEVYNTMEGLINHFKLVIDGIDVPAGETYIPTEAANGELGFFIVSDGGAKPLRVRCRPPCFLLLSSFSKLIEGHMIADATAILGSLNIIAGELER